MVISIGVMIIAGYKVVSLYGEYQAGIDEYKELEQYVTVEPAKALPQQTDVNTTEEKEGKPSRINVSPRINYAGLKAINEDFTGWLYYEPLDINYPIVRGDDNEYYTNHTFNGEENKSGAIFMDAYNWEELDGYNTFIYGHNMRNQTMFGKMRKLVDTENTIVEENPYFYIFTEDMAYMYEIFAVYRTTVDSDVYNLVTTKEEQEANIAVIKETATWLSDKEVTGDDKIVTLSTCYGTHTKKRTIVQGVLIEAEER